MYFQKDYVLRMIEMLGDLVRRIRSIAREADALAELDMLAQRTCGLPFPILRDGAMDTIEQLLDEPQRYFAAELILIGIEVNRRTHTDDVLMPAYNQALWLYSTLQSAEFASAAGDRVADILSRFLFQLPVATLVSCADLLERTGYYAAAEDAWYAAIDLAPSFITSAIAFYDRMSSIDDTVLRSGGLSREELVEGRASLTQ